MLAARAFGSWWTPSQWEAGATCVGVALALAGVIFTGATWRSDRKDRKAERADREQAQARLLMATSYPAAPSWGGEGQVTRVVIIAGMTPKLKLRETWTPGFQSEFVGVRVQNYSDKPFLEIEVALMLPRNMEVDEDRTTDPYHMGGGGWMIPFLNPGQSLDLLVALTGTLTWDAVVSPPAKAWLVRYVDADGRIWGKNWTEPPVRLIIP